MKLTQVPFDPEVRDLLVSNDSILDAVLANLPGVAFRCLNDRAWTMLYLSEGLRALSGHDAADFQGPGCRAYADLIHPDDRERVWDEIQAALAARRPYQVDYRLVRADGEPIWVWEKGQGAFGKKGELRFIDGVVIDAHARVLAEQELRQTGEKFQRLFEQVADAVIVMDGDTRVLAANARACALYGYSHDEWPALTAPDFSAEPEKTRQAIRDDIAHIALRWHRKKDGTPFPVELNTSHFETDGCVLHLAVIRDISERMAEEEALRRSREQLRAVLDAAPFPMAVVDTESSAVEYWSKSAEALLGFKVSTAREWYRTAYPDREYRHKVAEEWEFVVERARRSLGTAVNGGEYQVTCADGTVLDCELYAAFVADRMVVTLNDVTARKRSAEELRASEQRFRTLVEEAPIAIVVHTGGVYRYANRAARALYRETPTRTLVGNRVLDVTHPDYKQIVSQRIQSVKDQCPVPSLRSTMVALDGRHVEVEASAVPLSYEGEPSSLVFIADVTDRIKAEEEIRLRDEQLQQAQKMEAIGRLAGGIAHDFNNLLTAVLGYSDLLLSGDLSRPDEVRSDLMEIKNAAVRAKELTSQILAFSRRQPRQPRIVSANDLIKESEALLRRTLGEDVELVYRLARDAGAVEVDPGQFSQILVNFAVNARDAMPGGGRLMIDTSKIKWQGAPWMRLTVADTGTGMKPDTLERIFEPFFTTKKVGEGTGLGLATVYGIVAQSGGKITVESEPGAGTVFTILLPSVPETGAASSTQKARAVSRPVQAFGRERATILIVEDEPAVRGLAARVLRQQGFEVLVASDGAEAAVVAGEPGVHIDLLLTDVVLPGEAQGDAVAKMVQGEHPDAKCIFMSGYPKELIAKAGRLAADVSYLEKPFAPAALVRRVKETLGAG